MVLLQHALPVITIMALWQLLHLGILMYSMLTVLQFIHDGFVLKHSTVALI